MKEENINGSLLRSSPDQEQKIKSHAERRVKLTDTFIKKLKVKYKNGKKIVSSVGDSEVPGLRIYVEKSASKSFYYCYKPGNQRHTVRYPIGNFNITNVPVARDKARKYAVAIVDGKDPVQIKRELKAELTLKELIEDFYKKRLNRSFGYKPTTIKTIKVYFKVWIFQKSNDLKVHQVQKDHPYSLQHKKLSTITKQDIKMLHTIIGIKSPSVADKVIDYLNVVLNYGIEEEELLKNPVQIKKKERFGDKEDNRILTEEQRETVLNYVWNLDKRTGKINYNYYKSRKLNLVACAIIAYWLLTGRRNVSEGNRIKWKQISFPTKKIFFSDTKVGQKEYDLSPRALEVLRVIYGERLTDGPFLWKEGTREYVFPSFHFGKKNSKGEKCTTPYLASPKRTWARVLKELKIDYIPPKQCRHTFLTLLLHKSKNIMAVKEAAGHSNLKTTNRYAKILNEDVVSALDKMDQVKEKKSEVLEFKKNV